MRKITATAGSAVFLVIAPGVVAGLVPWWLTGWQPGVGWPVPVRITGAVLTGAGAAALLAAFAQFALQGRGPPAPPAPTEHLVVRGLYRYVRNPMYLAVLATITGQALLLSRPVLLGYAAAVAAAVITFVYGYEQPTLTRRYGAQYQAYKRAVPGWRPRLPPARKTPRPHLAPRQQCHTPPGAGPAPLYGNLDTTGGHHAHHRPSHRPHRLPSRRT
jgi:protein-S-isoprenylcysteine O-methyltransferase Ste14